MPMRSIAATRHRDCAAGAIASPTIMVKATRPPGASPNYGAASGTSIASSAQSTLEPYAFEGGDPTVDESLS